MEMVNKEKKAALERSKWTEPLQLRDGIAIAGIVLLAGAIGLGIHHWRMEGRIRHAEERSQGALMQIYQLETKLRQIKG